VHDFTKVGQTCAIRGHEQVDTIECESAEAALATLLIGGLEVAMPSRFLRRSARGFNVLALAIQFER
jgi:hypothetical protein